MEPRAARGPPTGNSRALLLCFHGTGCPFLFCCWNDEVSRHLYTYHVGLRPSRVSVHHSSSFGTTLAPSRFSSLYVLCRARARVCVRVCVLWLCECLCVRACVCGRHVFVLCFRRGCFLCSSIVRTRLGWQFHCRSLFCAVFCVFVEERSVLSHVCLRFFPLWSLLSAFYIYFSSFFLSCFPSIDLHAKPA